MQAIILAAGYGSRFSDDMKFPKCMLKIEGETIIKRQLTMLHESGFEKVVVATGFASRKVEEYLESLKREQNWNMEIVPVCNPFFRSTNVLGSFWFGMRELDDTFFYLEGDTIFEREMFDEVLKSRADCVLSIQYGSVDEEAMKVRISGNKLLEISKGIALDHSNGEFIGLAKFSQRALQQFKHYADERLRDEAFSDYFEYVLQESVNNRDDFSYDFIDIDGRYCCEIDFPEDYEYAKSNYRA